MRLRESLFMQIMPQLDSDTDWSYQSYRSAIVGQMIPAVVG
jgi:hypothetical protein